MYSGLAFSNLSASPLDALCSWADYYDDESKMGTSTTLLDRLQNGLADGINRIEQGISKFEHSVEDELRITVGEDKERLITDKDLQKENHIKNAITPLHVMGHEEISQLMDVLPPITSVALRAPGCKLSLIEHVFKNREHEKCMIIAKIYPIERADNIAGEKFAHWLVDMSGEYDDVIALAIETGVVPLGHYQRLIGGALPIPILHAI